MKPRILKILEEVWDDSCSVLPRAERVMTLWDMLRFFADLFCTTTLDLRKVEHHAVREAAEFGPQESMTGADELDAEKLAEKLIAQCGQIELLDARDEAGHLLSKIRSGKVADFGGCTYSELHTRLRTIRELVTRDFSNRLFAYIPRAKTNFFDNQCLFAEDVNAAFPSAMSDIRNAGRCYAADLNTTCVFFHLMRVAEVGLRALAWDRRVNIPKNRVIELATWEDIIKELEKAEHAIQGYKKTFAREAQLEFFHSAIMEFRRFKNVWRNRVMHAREEYDEHQALSVLNRVHEFMRILAMFISANKRTPMVWKKR
jgi:hypothetical protein